jgi:hypothetical protein
MALYVTCVVTGEYHRHPVSFSRCIYRIVPIHKGSNVKHIEVIRETLDVAQEEPVLLSERYFISWIPGVIATDLQLFLCQTKQVESTSVDPVERSIFCQFIKPSDEPSTMELGDWFREQYARYNELGHVVSTQYTLINCKDADQQNDVVCYLTNAIGNRYYE